MSKETKPLMISQQIPHSKLDCYVRIYMQTDGFFSSSTANLLEYFFLCLAKNDYLCSSTFISEVFAIFPVV